jgi:putative membrane protein
MLRLLTTSAIVSIGLVAAFPVAAQTTPSTHPGGATAAKVSLNQEDKTFAKEAAFGGLAEVELSKIAQKSENADVKRFADRMVQDHTAANDQLRQIATGLGLEVPKAFDSEHQRVREKIETLHGKAFDDRTCATWSPITTTWSGFSSKRSDRVTMPS